jgi:hypothetical protein
MDSLEQQILSELMVPVSLSLTKINEAWRDADVKAREIDVHGTGSCPKRTKLTMKEEFAKFKVNKSCRVIKECYDSRVAVAKVYSDAMDRILRMNEKLVEFVLEIEERWRGVLDQDSWGYLNEIISKAIAPVEKLIEGYNKQVKAHDVPIQLLEKMLYA